MNLPTIFQIFRKEPDATTLLLLGLYFALGYAVLFRVVKPQNHAQKVAVWVGGFFWNVL